MSKQEITLQPDHSLQVLASKVQKIRRDIEGIKDFTQLAFLKNEKAGRYSLPVIYLYGVLSPSINALANEIWKQRYSKVEE